MIPPRPGGRPGNSGGPSSGGVGLRQGSISASLPQTQSRTSGPGTSSERRPKENLGALDVRLTDEQFARLSAAPAS